jgi:hypothetical protein
MNASAQESSSGIVASTKGPISLRSGPVRSDLVMRSDSGPDRGSVKSLLEKLPPNDRVYLVFKELRVTAPPGILYHIYFDLPKDAAPAADDPHFVGNLNFFSEAPPPGQKTSPTGSGRSRSFEITQIVKKLAARNLMSEESSITIIPSRSREPEAEATVGGVDLVIQ